MFLSRHIGIVAVALMAACGGAWAQSSVLSSGDWWRLTVAESGMYRVGVAEVPALQGVAVSGIGLYGGNGEMMNTYNAITPTGDLQPVAIDVHDANGNGVFDAADYIVFYGEGTDVWRYDEGDARWEMRRHAYARANSYFLTTSAVAAMRVATAAPMAADTIVTSYTAVTVVDNDLYNIFSTGQKWMGEKFSTAVLSRTFTLTLPAQATDIRLRYALAYVGELRGSFTLSTTGLTVSHSLGNGTNYGTWLEAVNRTTQSLSIKLTLAPGSSAAEGYLDFIEMTGRVPLTFGGGERVVRTTAADGHAVAYTFGSGAPRVWDVTDVCSPREMNVDGGSWIDSGGMHCYVMFDGSALRSPVAVGRIANQDLHGSGQVDYVIVCNSLFRTQADRLASLHAVMDDVTTLVVTDQEVYNEFSSGKQDPMAIRALLRHLKAKHPENPPRWMLLFGKASYDPRDLKGLGVPTVVTFETPFSFDDDGVSYCSDDMMGYLENNETGSSMQTLDVGIGRLPAKSTAEADHFVDKIEGYMMRRDLSEGDGRGDWRNIVALLADDADPSRSGDTSFTHSSEYTASMIKQQFPAINIDRLYADAYRQQSGAIGSFYPDLNNALRQRMDYGCLLLNYVGHGSQKYIGTERYIEPSDITAYTNNNRLPLMVTSTCSYGWHDKPDDLCGAEMCVLADGAAVGVISAARPISHDERFNTDLVLFALDADNTIGDALRMAKNRTSVSPCIELTGDPALRLSVPRNRIVVTHIGGHEVQAGVDDTATVLSEVTVRGEVRDDEGTLLTDFDGVIYPIVFDRETRATTLANDNPGAEVGFVQQKSVLYKGSEVVEGGRFEYKFIVPRDVQYQYDYGKLSHYAVSGNEDATGSYGKLLFGGLNEDVVISEIRPEIRLFIGDTNFRSGGLTDETPTLVALLNDSVGINAFGSGLGHDITATIDGMAGSLVVLNDFFQADVNDPRSGVVRYTFSGIAPGMHTLTLKAWNIWGYSNTATLTFCVRPSSDPAVSSLSVYPNPATDHATFHYEISSADAVTSALLQIYTAQGVLVQSFVPVAGSNSNVLGPVRWDLSGIAPGFYLARMVVSTSDGNTHCSTAKVVVR